MVTDLLRIGNDPYFTSKSDWYTDSYAKGDKHTSEVSLRNLTVRERFVGYLAGDRDSADQLLKSVGVINGLSGVKITSTVSGEDLTINLEYTLQLWFDFFDVGKFPVKQSYTARMWK